MEKWLERLEKKVDNQDNRLDELNITLTEIKGDLKDHMRRSIANEEANILLKEFIDTHKEESNLRLSKLEKVKDRFHFLGWAFLTALGVYETLSKLHLL